MDIKLDQYGDIAVELVNGIPSLVLVDGRDAIAQHLRIVLRTFKGEWFADVNVGVPYHQVIFKKGQPDSVISQTFRRVVSAIPGVKEINSLEIIRDNGTRSVRIQLVIQTTDGENITLYEDIKI